MLGGVRGGGCEAPLYAIYGTLKKGENSKMSILEPPIACTLIANNITDLESGPTDYRRFGIAVFHVGQFDLSDSLVFDF